MLKIINKLQLNKQKKLWTGICERNMNLKPNKGDSNRNQTDFILFFP